MERRSSEPTPNFDPEALRQLRTSHGFSHDLLSEQVGISRPDLIAYEKGRKRPGVDRLAVLAKAFQVDPWALTTTDPSSATLAELRARAGLTRTAIAEKLGMARTTWDAVERNRRALRPEVARKAAKVIDKATRDLQPPGAPPVHVTQTDIEQARQRR